MLCSKRPELQTDGVEVGIVSKNSKLQGDFDGHVNLDKFVRIGMEI